MYRKRTRTIVVGLAIWLTSVAGHAAAPAAGTSSSSDESSSTADTADPFDLSLEELAELDVFVDVGSLFDESELVVGSTIGLVTSDDWRQRGARTVGDAIGNQAGVLVAPTTFAGHAVAIRGYTSTTGSVRGVNLRLDGVPINELNLSTGLMDLLAVQLGALDRVEMIRGPGSAIYGADAFHGVISLKTWERDRDTVEVDGAVGGGEYRQGAVRISQAVSDSVRFTGVISYDGQGDQELTYAYSQPAPAGTSSRRNKYDSFNGVFKLQTDEDRPWSGHGGLYLKGHDSERFQGLGQLAGVGSGPTDFGQSDSRFVMGQMGMVGKLGRDITIEPRLFGWRGEANRKTERIPFETDYTEGRVGAAVLFKQPNNAWNTQWVAGYEVDYAKIDESQTANSPVPDFVEGYSRRVHSLLAQAKTSFASNRWHVLYGLRHDSYSDADSHTAPRLGLIYQPKDDTAIKLLYGNAYRPPGGQELSPTALSAPATGVPETIDTFELSVLRHLTDAKVWANVFRSSWKDAILPGLNPTPPPQFARLNFGENKASGVEAGFTIHRGNLRADLSGSYVDSEDQSNDHDYVAFPKWIFNAGFGCSCPGPNIDLSLNNRIHLDSHEGPITGLVPEPNKLEDYWRVDATATWRHPNDSLNVFVNVLNIFDRDNYFPSPVGSEGGIPDIGVTLVIGIRYAM